MFKFQIKNTTYYPFYFFNGIFFNKKNKESRLYKLISNYFAVDNSEFRNLLDFADGLSDDKRLMINLKINHNMYNKKFKQTKEYTRSEYLTSIEKKLQIRRIIISRPTCNIKRDVNCLVWNRLCETTVELPDDIDLNNRKLLLNSLKV